MDNSLLGARHRRRIHLMRHGDVRYITDAGERVAEPDKVELTAHGQGQARAMADVLSEVVFDRAVCTSLKRTQQTIAPILAGRGLEREIVPELREIISSTQYVPLAAPAGELPERTYILERAQEPDARWSGGERLADFYTRITGAIEALVAEGDWRSMILVGHGVTNRAILSWATGGGLATLSAFEQDTCCLNIIDVDVREKAVTRALVRQVNMTPENLTKQGIYQTSLERGYDDWRQHQRALAD